jgi:hypothetical protein
MAVAYHDQAFLARGLDGASFSGRILSLLRHQLHYSPQMFVFYRRFCNRAEDHVRNFVPTIRLLYGSPGTMTSPSSNAHRPAPGSVSTTSGAVMSLRRMCRHVERNSLACPWSRGRLTPVLWVVMETADWLISWPTAEVYCT